MRASKMAQLVKVPTAKKKNGNPQGLRRETTPTKLSCHTQVSHTFTQGQKHTRDKKQSLLNKSMKLQQLEEISSNNERYDVT